MNYFFNALTKIDVFIVIFTKNIVYILIGMKNTILLVMFMVSFFSISNAEELILNKPDVLTGDTLWLNKRQKVCNKEDATYCRVIFPNQSLDYIVSDYYLTGELYMTGKLISLKPEIREGDFIYFHINGKIKSKVKYVDGISTGSKYWDINGNVLKEYPKDPNEEMPQFPNGDRALMKFILSNLRYPKTSNIDRPHGRVVVRFTIDENGNVVDPVILKSVHKLLDDETLRMIKSMPRWKPGTYEGKPVSVDFTLPFNFQLVNQEQVSVKQKKKLTDKNKSSQ